MIKGELHRHGGDWIVLDMTPASQGGLRSMHLLSPRTLESDRQLLTVRGTVMFDVVKSKKSNKSYAKIRKFISKPEQAKTGSFTISTTSNVGLGSTTPGSVTVTAGY